MTEENNASSWLQDNLRIIISVGIVILLVFAIYSYSKRNSRTDIVVDDSQIEEVAMTNGKSSNEINEIIDEIKDDQANVDSTVSEQVVTTEDADTAADNEQTRLAKEQEMEEARIAQDAAEQKEREVQEQEMKNAQIPQETTDQQAQQESERQKAGDIVREVIESRSTQQVQKKDGIVVVTAVYGDSMTTLARKAAGEYINSNSTGSLTASHKIYIEDYLRKIKNARSIHPGTEMEFTNAEIANAIEQSQKLSQSQLDNLAKYAQNVPGL